MINANDYKTFIIAAIILGISGIAFLLFKKKHKDIGRVLSNTAIAVSFIIAVSSQWYEFGIDEGLRISNKIIDEVVDNDFIDNNHEYKSKIMLLKHNCMGRISDSHEISAFHPLTLLFYTLCFIFLVMRVVSEISINQELKITKAKNQESKDDSPK